MRTAPSSSVSKAFHPSLVGQQVIEPAGMLQLAEQPTHRWGHKRRPPTALTNHGKPSAARVAGAMELSKRAPEAEDLKTLRLWSGF